MGSNVTAVVTQEIHIYYIVGENAELTWTKRSAGKRIWLVFLSQLEAKTADLES